MAEGLDDKLDGFDVPVDEARAKVNEKVSRLGYHALRVISALTSVPLGQLTGIKTGREMETKYLPVVYNHFFK
mgnify:CR=1 FL=1